MRPSGKPNYYELLEVTPDASQAEVSKAYQKAKQTYDVENPALYSMFSPEEARELLKMIDEAYGVLGNTQLRREYDQAHGHTPRVSAQVTKPAAVSHQSSASSYAPAPSQKYDSGTASASPTAKEPASSYGPSAIATTSDSYTVRPKADAKPTPPDQGKTQLSTYKIDKYFEEEIAGMTDFEGATLKKIREYKNISLDRMSELSRISKSYLNAVESNDYKNLPAAVFVRGFIVQIARALGLDEQKTATAYMKLFKAGGGK